MNQPGRYRQAGTKVAHPGGLSFAPASTTRGVGRTQFSENEVRVETKRHDSKQSGRGEVRYFINESIATSNCHPERRKGPAIYLLLSTLHKLYRQTNQ